MNNFLANQLIAHDQNGLPPIIFVTQNNSDIVVEMFVSPDLPCFVGHFPEFAILPGVLQIDWVIQLALAQWPDLGDFSGMDTLRFARPILPGQRMILKIQRDLQRINFVWLLIESEISQIQCSSGRIRFVAA